MQEPNNEPQEPESEQPPALIDLGPNGYVVDRMQIKMVLGRFVNGVKVAEVATREMPVFRLVGADGRALTFGEVVDQMADGAVIEAEANPP